MGTLVEIQGDLFDPQNKVIAQGCNCVGLMGAGVAKLVRERHEIAYQKYRRAIEAGVFVPGYAQFVRDQENDRCIYNLATQSQPGADATYWWVYLSFANMFEHAKANGISAISIPFIGAGIGGLEWPLVKLKINAAMKDTNFPGTVKAIYL